MPTKVYSTNFGLFSVIADDAILTAYHSLSSGRIWSNGATTELGETVLSTLPLFSLYNTVACNDPSFNQSIGERILSNMPNTNIKQLGCTSSTTIENIYVLSGNKKARTTERIDGSIPDIIFNCYLVNDNTEIQIGSYKDFPYGKFVTSRTGGQQANIIYISFLISNTNMTNFEYFSLDYDSSRTYFSKHTFSEADNTFLTNYFSNVAPHVDTSDPYKNGGTSDSGGGDGDFTPHGEDITDPEIPDVDAVSTGFITLFNPSVSELNSLASYMWSGGFDVNTFKKLFANPMDCILGLSILPKIVPNGGSATVLVGNISTGVSMTKAARQYIKYDCGSINISRFSNSFLDYEPYTKINLYLPFIGMHQISTDDVMNKTLQVKYTVDILSGACVAFVIAGGTTLYTFIGQCAASVPITSQDWSTMINGVLGAVGSIASMAGSIATGNIAGAVGGVASMAQNVINSKPSVEHSGNMGGMGGMLGIKTPYVIIERPAQAIPLNQNEFIGYPSFVTKNFSDLIGYNEVYSTHLENISATESELREIESLLKSGVIF